MHEMIITAADKFRGQTGLLGNKAVFRELDSACIRNGFNRGPEKWVIKCCQWENTKKGATLMKLLQKALARNYLSYRIIYSHE